MDFVKKVDDRLESLRTNVQKFQDEMKKTQDHRGSVGMFVMRFNAHTYKALISLQVSLSKLTDVARVFTDDKSTDIRNRTEALMQKTREITLAHMQSMNKKIPQRIPS